MVTQPKGKDPPAALRSRPEARVGRLLCRDELSGTGVPDPNGAPPYPARAQHTWASFSSLRFGWGGKIPLLLTHSAAGPRSETQPWEGVYCQPATGKEEKKKKKPSLVLHFILDSPNWSSSKAGFEHRWGINRFFVKVWPSIRIWGQSSS